MSDNASPQPLGELLDSLSPSPPPGIDAAVTQAANGREADSAATFLSDHTVVDYVPAVEECPICLETFAIEPCRRITGIGGCNHHFGQDCLENMLRDRPNEEKRCPLCRAVWIPGQHGYQQESESPRSWSPVDSGSDFDGFEELGANQTVEDIRAGRQNLQNPLNAYATGLGNNAGRSAVANSSSQPSSNTLETAIVLDSDSDSDYETQRRNYESFTRGIQDVRSRARNTQLSRSERRREARSQRHREEQEHSQVRRNDREVARGRSRSLSGNRRHTSSGESSSAARRSDQTSGPTSSGFFPNLNPFRPTATGLSDGDRNRTNRQGSHSRRPGTQWMRPRFGQFPRSEAQQGARDTSPPSVAFSPPPRRSSLQLPPGFATPGQIVPSHLGLPTYNELLQTAQSTALPPPAYVQAELAQVELRQVELSHRERALNNREDELDRRDFEVQNAEQRMAEWREMMTRHQEELRALLQRHQEEIERTTL